MFFFFFFNFSVVKQNKHGDIYQIHKVPNITCQLQLLAQDMDLEITSAICIEQH